MQKTIPKDQSYLLPHIPPTLQQTLSKYNRQNKILTTRIADLTHQNKKLKQQVITPYANNNTVLNRMEVDRQELEYNRYSVDNLYRRYQFSCGKYGGVGRYGKLEGKSMGKSKGGSIGYEMEGNRSKEEREGMGSIEENRMYRYRQREQQRGRVSQRERSNSLVTDQQYPIHNNDDKQNQKQKQFKKQYTYTTGTDRQNYKKYQQELQQLKKQVLSGRLEKYQKNQKVHSGQYPAANMTSTGMENKQKKYSYLSKARQIIQKRVDNNMAIVTNMNSGTSRSMSMSVGHHQTSTNLRTSRNYNYNHNISNNNNILQQGRDHAYRQRQPYIVSKYSYTQRDHQEQYQYRNMDNRYGNGRMYGYTSTSLYGDDGDNGKMDRNEKLSLRVKTEPKISKDSGGYGGYAGDRDVDGLDEYRYRNESIGSYKQYDKYYNMESDRYNGKESSQYNTNMNTTTNTKINPSNNNPNPNPSQYTPSTNPKQQPKIQQKTPTSPPLTSPTKNKFSKNVYLEKQTFIDEESDEKIPTFVEASFGNKQVESPKEYGHNATFGKFNSGGSSCNGNLGNGKFSSIGKNSLKDSTNSHQSKKIKQPKTNPNPPPPLPQPKPTLQLAPPHKNYPYYNKTQLQNILKQHQNKHNQKTKPKKTKTQQISIMKCFKLDSREAEKHKNIAYNQNNQNQIQIHAYNDKIQNYQLKQKIRMNNPYIPKSDNKQNIQGILAKKTNLPYIGSDYKLIQPKTQLNRIQNINNIIHCNKQKEKENIVKIIDIDCDRDKDKMRNCQKQKQSKFGKLDEDRYSRSARIKGSNQEFQYKISLKRQSTSIDKHHSHNPTPIKQPIQVQQFKQHPQNTQKQPSSQTQNYQNQYQYQQQQNIWDQNLNQNLSESNTERQSRQSGTIIQHLNLSTNLTTANLYTNSYVNFNGSGSRCSNLTNTNAFTTALTNNYINGNANANGNGNLNENGKKFNKSMIQTNSNEKIKHDEEIIGQQRRKTTIFGCKKTYLNVMSKIPKPSLFLK